MKDVVAIVTGGASGIGAATATLLASRGAAVVVADRDADGAARLASEINAEHGGRAEAMAVDVSNIESCSRLFERVSELGMAPNALVNSAGIARRAALQEMSPENWDRVMAVNLTGTMTMSRLFAEQVGLRGGSGAIVNITSVLAHFATTNLGSYAVSKSGVAMLTRVLALELGPTGIRANAVSPGYIETPMADQTLSVPRFRDAVLARTPLKRLGNALDVARVIVFLLSDDAAFVTGQVLGVDGGLTAGDASLTPPTAAEMRAV
ncbi:MAG: SDR family NAD(P)-dependent oxidoreductase [Candidatus Dormibacteria bacterium]